MSDISAFGPIWDNWMIDEMIGQGSYGTVWKAHSSDQFTHITQYAAVKHISIPKEGCSEDDMPSVSTQSRVNYYKGMLDQLVLEIQAMVDLKGKQNIVSYEAHKVIPKADQAGYDLFLRMELLTSLNAYVKQKNGYLTREDVIKLGTDIAHALEILQKKNYVHRDIKPANIFVDAYGEFKLGDFGTARILEHAANASTKTGTPNYMAPEVYSGSSKYDQTVDIYSLGIVLYRYMNNNFLPFMSDKQWNQEDALMRRIRMEKLEPPAQADSELAQVILKACAFYPKDRYQTATEFREALQQAARFSPAPIPILSVEVPVECVLEDGTIILQKNQPCFAGQENIIQAPRECEQNDYELVSPVSVSVQVNTDGIFSPDKARFIWRSVKTLYATTVQITCLDTQKQIIFQDQYECYSDRKNIIHAPDLEGYELTGKSSEDVIVLEKGKTFPNEAVFYYKIKEPQIITVSIPLRCVLENGSEIMRKLLTLKSDKTNLIDAPSCTGYKLISGNHIPVAISAEGVVSPSEVIFTYQRQIHQVITASVPIICRLPNGKILKQYTISCGSDLENIIKPPTINGYIIQEDHSITVSVDPQTGCNPSSITFMYIKPKQSVFKKIIVVLIFLITLTVIAFLFISVLRLDRNSNTAQPSAAPTTTSTIAVGSEPTKAPTAFIAAHDVQTAKASSAPTQTPVSTAEPTVLSVTLTAEPTAAPTSAPIRTTVTVQYVDSSDPLKKLKPDSSLTFVDGLYQIKPDDAGIPDGYTLTSTPYVVIKIKNGKTSTSAITFQYTNSDSTEPIRTTVTVQYVDSSDPSKKLKPDSSLTFVDGLYQIKPDDAGIPDGYTLTSAPYVVIKIKNGKTSTSTITFQYIK